MIWEFMLIIAVGGMFVLLVRRLPKAVETYKETRAETPVAPKPEPVREEPIQSEPDPEPVQQVERNETPVRTSSTSTIEDAEDAMRHKDFGRAIALFESLLAEDRKNPRLYNRLGMCYLELEQFHDARDAFRTALKLDNSVAAHYANLGMAEYALGHRLTAVRHLKRAMTMEPHKQSYQDLLRTFESEGE